MSIEAAFQGSTRTDSYVPREASERCVQALDAWAGGAGARLAVLWGPSGIGKTLMMRLLERRLEGQARTIYVPNPIFGPAAMALWALDSLGVEPDLDRQGALLRAADELRRNGTDVLLLIDDVELLPVATEEWLLTKAANHLSILMTVTDSGRRDRLLESADGGATLITFATPMGADETSEFVLSQLDRLDLPPAVLARFDADTLSALHERCEGLPVHVQNEASMLLREAMDAVRPARAQPQHWSLGSQIVSIGQDEATASDVPPTSTRSAAQWIRNFPLSPYVGLGIAFLAGFAFATTIGILRGDDPVVEQAGAFAASSAASVSSPPPTDPTIEADDVVAWNQPRPEPPAATNQQTAPERGPSRRSLRQPAVVAAIPSAVAPGPTAPSPDLPSAGTRRAAVRSPILVAINAQPWGHVRIDGEAVGDTPMAEIPLDAGRHRFEVRLADGRVIARDIEISESNRHLRFE